MARKRTGLRNRFRSGQSTYCLRKKGREADRYGHFNGGQCEDVVAGHVIRYKTAGGGMPSGQKLKRLIPVND